MRHVVVTTKRQLPDHLVRAIHEDGELTDEQLVELITFEAAELGLTFDEAIGQAREYKLPKSDAGGHLQMLIWMLLYDHPSEARSVSAKHAAG